MIKKFSFLFASIIFSLLGYSVLFSACTSKPDACIPAPNVSHISIEIETLRLESMIQQLGTKEEIVAFMGEHPFIRDYFFRRELYPNDSIFINALHARFTHPEFGALLQEVQLAFGDFSRWEAQFRQAFAYMKHYYPDFTPPRIETLVTGLETDMYISDTVIMLSLDFFLGQGSKYRPKDFHAYQLKRYSPEYLVSSAILLFGIHEHYNKVDLSDRTILSEMVSYGKAFYFTKQMVPCTPDSILIWYTAEEMKGVRDNQDVIWIHFLENEILYETNHMVKRKYIEDRPKTYEIGEECPGRIGTWVGWEIVQKYMEENPQVALPELMANTNSQEIFAKSKYKPKGKGWF
jgi:hypothetical protein